MIFDFLVFEFQFLSLSSFLNLKTKKATTLFIKSNSHLFFFFYNSSNNPVAVLESCLSVNNVSKYHISDHVFKNDKAKSQRLNFYWVLIYHAF